MASVKWKILASQKEEGYRVAYGIFETDYDQDYVYCLITSNHLIPVDNLLFHDWEDLN